MALYLFKLTYYSDVLKGAPPIDKKTLAIYTMQLKDTQHSETLPKLFGLISINFCITHTEIIIFKRMKTTLQQPLSVVFAIGMAFHC